MRTGVLFVSFLLSAGVEHTASQDSGSVECPCATAAWAGFDAVAAEAAEKGYPANYGLQGCSNYDVGITQTGCDRTNPPEYCSNVWCYVDPVECGVVEQECLDAGHTLNDKVHKACRSREMHQSLLFTAEAFYSYATCGYLDSYDTSHLRSLIEGKKVFATTTDDMPYTTLEYVPGTTEGERVPQFGGVLVDFLMQALEEFEVPVLLEMMDTWATEASRARFSSSYTACVNDVAVGTYDLAVGDFWMTSERVLMTPFLPAIRSDVFYLVAFVEEGSSGFLTMLGNPFKPFDGEAWGVIVGVVGFTALAMAFISAHDSDELSEYGKSRSHQRGKPWWLRLAKSLFVALASLVKGESKYSTGSVPSKLCYLGFQLFLLVVLASYTANLASMLVVTRMDTGVSSIAEAIAQGLVICVPSALERPVALLYPAATVYVYGGSSADFARHMHGGRCDVAVIHQKRIDQLYSGQIHQADCAKAASGELSEEDAQCDAGRMGGGRDDCQIQSVGDVIFSIPVAFPVREGSGLLGPLTWAITKAQNSGQWERAMQENSQLFPASQCQPAALASERLGKEAFAGVSFFVAVLTVVALALDAVGKGESEEGAGAEQGGAAEAERRAAVDGKLEQLAADIQELLAEKREAERGLQGQALVTSRLVLLDAHGSSLDAHDGAASEEPPAERKAAREVQVLRV